MIHLTLPPNLAFVLENNILSQKGVDSPTKIIVYFQIEFYCRNLLPMLFVLQHIQFQIVSFSMDFQN
jgi:hypothetical protein